MSPESPKRFVDILRQNVTKRPLDVGLVLIDYLLDRYQPKTAKLTDGQKMTVMIPESISGAIWFTGDYEPEVAIAMQTILQRGMTLWNIGAHIGLRVVQGNGKVCRDGVIYAFEPTPRTYRVLKQNSENRQATIATSSEALSDTEGTFPLQDYGWGYSGCNTLAVKSRIPTMRRFRKAAPTPIVHQVHVETVDHLIEQRSYRVPDMLVVDAEGYELQIFQGAIATLDTARPIIVFESGDLGESQTLPSIQLLQSHGYQIFEMRQNMIVSHQIRETYPEAGNLLAIHPQAARGAHIKLDN